jgi:hypothetical protein
MMKRSEVLEDEGTEAMANWIADALTEANADAGNGEPLDVTGNARGGHALIIADAQTGERYYVTVTRVE